MSLLRKILLFARSAGVKVGGGESSDPGGTSIGFGAIHSVGGGVGIWSFAGPRGGVAQGFKGHVNRAGGVAV